MLFSPTNDEDGEYLAIRLEGDGADAGRYAYPVFTSPEAGESFLASREGRDGEGWEVVALKMGGFLKLLRDGIVRHSVHFVIFVEGTDGKFRVMPAVHLLAELDDDPQPTRKRGK